VAGHPVSQTAQLPPLITLEVKSGFAWLYDKYIDQVDENTEANYWNAQEQKRGDTQTGAAHTRLIQDYLGHKNITHTVRYTKLAPEDIFKITPEQATQRFEHYELLKGEDGKPLELGRGAVGITYKAYDIDLQCPVALKVINERCLGDESARLRFLREARSAARVRHPNVASVFHLGRTGQNYFYAMEFVEGETLENLINRSGRLKVKGSGANC
jgi:Protein kinase domain